jgi:hypothetical protein
MTYKVQVQVPVPITMQSDEDLLNELNRRGKLVKWVRKALKEPCKPAQSEERLHGCNS